MMTKRTDKRTILRFAVTALTVLLFFGVFCGAGAAVSGAGSENNPFVYTAAEWNSLTTASQLNTLTGYIKIKGGEADNINPKSFTFGPSGTVTIDFSEYRGTFAGYLTASESCKGALFDKIESTQQFDLTIKNLKMNNVNVTGSGSSTEHYGGIVGYVKGKSKDMSTLTFENCTLNECTVHADGYYVGGLVGKVDSAGCQYTNCVVEDCTISSGKFYVGGLVGGATCADSQSASYHYTNCVVKDCNMSGDGDGDVGGLVGGVYGGSSASTSCRVDGCEVEGCNMSGGNRVGGLVGHAYRMMLMDVTDCKVADCKVVATGSLSTNTAAGFIGMLEMKSGGVSASYSNNVMENVMVTATSDISNVGLVDMYNGALLKIYSSNGIAPLKEIVFNGTNGVMMTVRNCAVCTTGGSPKAVIGTSDYSEVKDKITKVIVGDGDKITSVEASAFSGCTDLVSVNGLDAVTAIGASAFSGCTNLGKDAGGLYLPKVTTIGANAFTGCSELKVIYVKTDALAAASFPTGALVGIDDTKSSPNVYGKLVGDNVKSGTFAAKTGGSFEEIVPIDDPSKIVFFYEFGDSQMRTVLTYVENKKYAPFFRPKPSTNLTFNTEGKGTCSEPYGNITLGESDVHNNVTGLLIPPGNLTASRPGYTFAGWNISTSSLTLFNKTGKLVPGTVDTYVKDGKWNYSESELTLSAYWIPNQTRVFLKNETDKTFDTITLTYNESVESLTSSPAKDGHTFGGWYNETGGLGTMIINVTGDYQEVDGYVSSGKWANESAEITLYANWTANTTTVMFHNETETEDKINTYGKTVNLSADPAKTGYTFQGWNVTFDSCTTWCPFSGNNSFIDNDDKWVYTGAADPLDVYANWTANVTQVKFHLNNGTTTSVTISNTYDQATAVPAEPVYEGYTFAGWNVSDDSGWADFNSPAYNASSTWKHAAGGDLAVYANWTANIYLITNTSVENGTVTADKTQAIIGETITVTAEANEGYHFEEWNVTNSTHTIPVTSVDSPSGTFTMPASDVNVSAKFAGNITILNLTDAAGQAFAERSETYNEINSSVVSPLPTKPNFIFKGWNVSDNAGVQLISANGELQKNQSGYTDNNGIWINSTLANNTKLLLTPQFVFNCSGSVFDGNSTIEETADGIVISLTNDITGPVTIPDNWGNIILDMNGLSIITVEKDPVTGTGKPGIIFVNKDRSVGTNLTIKNSQLSGGFITGADGRDATTSAAAGNGGAGITADPGADTCTLKIETGVTVQAGKGGNGYDADECRDGAAGGAGIDNTGTGITNVDVTDGKVAGGNGGNGANGSDSAASGNGGAGGAGISGNIPNGITVKDNGKVTGGKGGDGADGTGTTPGSNGGVGGAGIDAATTAPNGVNVEDTGKVVGGAGGNGGNSVDGNAGAGGAGGIGSNTSPTTVTGGEVTGGKGGNGGAAAGTGNGGVGGAGGDAAASETTVSGGTTKGGNGGDGGDSGSSTAGNGGAGGAAPSAVSGGGTARGGDGGAGGNTNSGTPGTGGNGGNGATTSGTNGGDGYVYPSPAPASSSSSSSRNYGASVWLPATAEPTSVPTTEPTPVPTASPVNPAETSASPVPLAGVLAGLGAALLFGLKRK